MLTVEELATVLAHQEHYGAAHAAEVRERLAVDDVWDESFAHWVGELDRDADRDDPQFVVAFGTRLTATKEALSESAPPLEELKPLERSQADDTSAQTSSPEETAAIDVVVPKAALPFSGRAAVAPPSSLLLAGRDDRAGMTAAVDVVQLAPATLPFMDAVAPGAEVPAGDLTLEQYASLSAELIAQPQRRATILARYHSDETQLKSLQQAWRARFAREAQTEARYHELVRSYRDWLERQR